MKLLPQRNFLQNDATVQIKQVSFHKIGHILCSFHVSSKHTTVVNVLMIIVIAL